MPCDQHTRTEGRQWILRVKVTLSAETPRKIKHKKYISQNKYIISENKYLFRKCKYHYKNSVEFQKN